MSRPEPLRTLPEQAFRARARLVALLLCGICFAGLIARLYWLQLAAGDWYTRRALGQQLRDTVVPADRGRIYSADGVLLAANSSCWTLRASPREMPADKLELAAHGLAQILELDEAALLEKFRDRASNDCLLRYRVERSMADAVRDFCEENSITGIRINQDSKRWYPQGEFLASVLGFTNVDNAGVSGLELEYNEQLTGQNGVVLTAVNAWGYTLEQSYETEQFPVEGSSLWLTIDANIQHYLENALNYAVQEHHVAARTVGIVLDVNTGAVLAMSTTPAYDPNQPRVLADKAAREAVERLSGDERTAALQLAQQTQWRNKAVSDLYEPGSVFKLITCAAALDTGAVSKNSSFYCGESISVAGTRFHCANHKRHGAQTVTQALENSCNQSFIQIGARLGKEAFCDYFAAFGLREPTGIDLPAEPKKSLYYTADRMGPVELASCAFGQSSKISYLEMASAVCAVVNGGRLMKPYLVEAIEDSDGNVLEQTSPKVVSTPISAETSATMRKLLYGVVENGGGKNAKVNGYAIGGKTGTAQIYRNGKIESNLHIGSFVGFAPADNPRVALLVTVNEAKVKPDYGGTTAAPFAAQIFEEILPLLGVSKTEGGAEAKQTTMPDVTGMNVRDAKAILREAGIDAVTDGENPIVTGQLPPAGTTVQEGFCAMLYVTGESAPQAQDYARVPDVIGLDMRRCAQEIRLSGFEMNAQGEGLAAGQSPTGGSYAPTGTQVRVTFEMP